MFTPAVKADRDVWMGCLWFLCARPLIHFVDAEEIMNVAEAPRQYIREWGNC